MVPKFKNKAACEGTDTDMWFQDRDFSNYRLLRRICNGCPAKRECLDYALYNNVIGFWAGTTMHQRRLLRKQNNIIPIPVIPEWEYRRRVK